jgi:hypothetical protein
MKSSGSSWAAVESGQRRLRVGTTVVEIAEEAVTGGIVGIRLGRALQQRQGFIEPEFLGEHQPFTASASGRFG